MSRYSSDKRVADFIEALISQGWCWESRGKHARLIAPAGKGFVTIARSPSCHRALDNIRRDIRRMLRPAMAA